MTRPNSTSPSAIIALALSAVALVASWTLTLDREESGLMISSYGEETGTETASGPSTAR